MTNIHELDRPKISRMGLVAVCHLQRANLVDDTDIGCPPCQSVVVPQERFSDRCPARRTQSTLDPLGSLSQAKPSAREALAPREIRVTRPGSGAECRAALVCERHLRSYLCGFSDPPPRVVGSRLAGGSTRRLTRARARDGAPSRRRPKQVGETLPRRPLRRRRVRQGFGRRQPQMRSLPTTCRVGSRRSPRLRSRRTRTRMTTRTMNLRITAASPHR